MRAAAEPGRCSRARVQSCAERTLPSLGLPCPVPEPNAVSTGRQGMRNANQTQTRGVETPVLQSPLTSCVEAPEAAQAVDGVLVCCSLLGSFPTILCCTGRFSCRRSVGCGPAVWTRANDPAGPQLLSRARVGLHALSRSQAAEALCAGCKVYRRQGRRSVAQPLAGRTGRGLVSKQENRQSISW